jgi:glycine cleavage system transcriptional repressor
MATMGGCFSIMTLFSCTPKIREEIEKALGRIKEEGFSISLHDAQDPTLKPSRPELPLKVEVLAMDHPGIVRKIVHILRTYDVNIHSLSTQVKHAPLSGAPMFNLVLEAGVPAERPIAMIKEELAALAADENLDLIFPR